MSRKKQIKETSSQLDLEGILRALRESEGELTAADLTGMFELNRSGQKALKQLLDRLQGAGLLRRRGQAFRWSHSGRALVGTIRQRRRKVISFLADAREDRARGMIRIEPEDLNGAFDGDRVIAVISASQREGERLGKVEMILRRGKLKIIGRVRRGFRGSWVESLDEKFLHDIDIEKKDATKLDEGCIVAVEVTDYPVARQNPRGRVIQHLGATSDEPGMDIEIVIHKHDLPHVFPEEVIAESEAVSSVVTGAQIAGRLDLRDTPTVTIDGETARDFDDAISLKRLDNGNFHLGVHIADVSYYVREGTPLDQEARLRGTSVYFPERAIPMLPERLSNGICSLNPKVDRLTMSSLMEVDGRGRVVHYELRETVIRSNERMTYTDVNKLLKHADPQLAMRYADLLDLFKAMEQLARILIRMRTQRGAIDFNLPESIFDFDDEGRIEGVIKAERNIAHRIIEEFMLLANETVAGHFTRVKIPSIYRIHEEPSPQRVLEFAELAAAYGYRFPVEGVGSKDYQRLSKQLEGKPEERVLSYAMLRSLQRARYTSANVGHFGLAAPVYTHFTSPIRRYPDLIVHRLLRKVARRPKDAPLSAGDLDLLAEEASDRERAAEAAERELEQWRKAKFMAERLGEEFDGLITNVREFGFFVELEDFFIEGLVQVSSLKDDFYQFDERRRTLTGRSRKRAFRLGDRVRIRVDRVNIDRHLVDFSVVAGSKSR
ncbi:MAG: ribonuclease R [Blastocatellia bacterium]